jgi:hypothetical protein
MFSLAIPRRSCFWTRFASSVWVATFALHACLPFATAQETIAPAQANDERGPQREESEIDVLVEDADAKAFTVPDSLKLRVRIVRMQPFAPTQIHYKYGGWGSNGERVYGHFWKPKAAPVANKPAPKDDLDALLNGPAKSPQPKPPAVSEGLKGVAEVDFRGRAFVDKPPEFALGEWSEFTPLTQFVPGGATNPRFLQIFAGSGGREEGSEPGGGRRYVGAARDFEVEFEFEYDGKPLKKFSVRGPDGAIAPIVIPFAALVAGVKPTDATFLDHLVPLETYAARRADWAESQPWARGPKPKQLAMVTNLGGYGKSHLLGIRHADPAIVGHEARLLRAMGINGFQSGPSILLEQAMRHEGVGAELARADEGGAHGYPIPRATDPSAGDDAGCPFAPGVPEAKRRASAAAIDDLRAHRGFHMLQGTTVDEIASAVNLSKTGKEHLTTCLDCRRGFHEFLRGGGLTPAYFGANDWSEVVPVVRGKNSGDGGNWFADKRRAMLGYWTWRFNIFASAQLFSDLRAAARSENAKKRAALAAGDLHSDVATQPWHYPGAMRTNAFLMGGSSLDYFDFYRTADNAFIYETSNRDPRIWSWDSYLCDVGRIVTAQPDMGQELFGVYVKPHRGAGLQRGLSAVSRGARYINWYTYGPPYAKGDDWGAKPEMIELVGQANRLIAAAEDVLDGGRWARPARIAVVKPGASETWLHLTEQAPLWTAAWENAKWVYTALAHAHLPVDPIDQTMIRSGDLSAYRVIYVNGPALEREAAEKLAQWVRDGGTLVTMGYGLAYDEYLQPLDALLPTLGLQRRGEPQLWHATKTYGATKLPGFDDATRIGPTPATAAVTVVGAEPFVGGYELTVGREVLEPLATAETLARFGDGGAAVTRHRVGDGEAYVLGFFAGLEYAVPLMHDRYDMLRDFETARRQFVVAPALAKTEPVVAASVPTVEGILIRHPDTGRQVVTLMNWTYGITAVRAIRSERGEIEKPVAAHRPLDELTLTVRGAGKVARVRSVMLDRDLAVQAADGGDGIVIALPRLAEGDILLLDPLPAAGPSK